MPQKTLCTLQKMKRSGSKIAALTAYDASFAHQLSTAGVDVLLVGDSLGNVVQGLDSAIPVTMDHMVYHTQAVSQGNQGAFLMTDMPFMSQSTLELALDNATALMQAGAHMVKIEGGQWLSPTIQVLTERGIPVCGHIGLTAQYVHRLGGYKIQGRTEAQAEQLLADAKALEAAGCQLIVLECMPAALATTITEHLSIPTIGIGAGKDCDGQILVTYDVLGLTPNLSISFCQDFLEGNPKGIPGAIADYVSAVKSGTFPSEKHTFT